MHSSLETIPSSPSATRARDSTATVRPLSVIPVPVPDLDPTDPRTSPSLPDDLVQDPTERLEVDVCGRSDLDPLPEEGRRHRSRRCRRYRRSQGPLFVPRRTASQGEFTTRKECHGIKGSTTDPSRRTSALHCSSPRPSTRMKSQMRSHTDSTRSSTRSRSSW